MSGLLAPDPPGALLRERERVITEHLEREQERLARICHDLARAFARGGTLICLGRGAAASEAVRLASAFMHPDGDDRRARPALASAGAATLACLGRSDDAALAVTHGPADHELQAFLDEARRRGLLGVALVARGGAPPKADHVVVVDADDPWIVHEVQQTVCRMLPDLVDRFFDHPGLLEEQCLTCGDVAVAGRVVALGDHGAVIELAGGREDVAVDLVADVKVGDLLLCHAGVALERLPDGAAPTAVCGGEELDAVLAEVSAAIVAAGADAAARRAEIDVRGVTAFARRLRLRLNAGARVLVCGEGRSALAAQDLAGDVLGRGWPAIALAGAADLVTLGRRGDVVVALAEDAPPDGVAALLADARRLDMVSFVVSGGDTQATTCHLLLEAIGGRT